MDNIDPDTNEQELFAELLRNSELDDSVCEEHRAELRNQVLDAFDRSDAPDESFDPVVQQSVITNHWNVRNTLLAIASIAACLIFAATFWSANWSGIDRSVVVEPEPASSENIDRLLLATITEVDAWKDSVPADAFFDALAQCELQLETTILDNKADEMRWLYESSLSNPEIPKG